MDRDQLLNDNEAALKTALRGWQSGLWTAMPGIVQSVDLSAMTCEVQPSIQGTVEDETGKLTPVNYPLLVDVPIVFPSAGGFSITLPISSGDEVLIVFASRCIDAWWQSGGEENRPMEARMHDLSDGFAIPGPRSQPNTVSAISSTSAQIRNDAGTTYIEIAPTGAVTILSPTSINLLGNVVVGGTLALGGALIPPGGAGGTVAVQGSVSTTGGVAATGAVTAASVAAVGEVTAGSTPLHTHVHTSAVPGSPTSGPIP